MLFKLTLGAGVALLPFLSTQAQDQSPASDPARFAAERDSLTQQAATIRTQTDAQIRFFKTSFVALRGTRRCTKSYMTFPAATLPAGRPAKLPKALAKKHIVKFKRVGTMVEKIYYYNAQGSETLAEHYQDGQLVRQETAEYYQIAPQGQVTVVKTESGQYRALTSNASRRNPLKEVKFLRGDYIIKTTRRSIPQRKNTRVEYFVAPRPQAQGG